MPVFGPRLDRPSAVGDEGRPSATSLGVAGLTVLGLAVLVGWRAELLGILGTLGTFAGITVAGVALLCRDRLGPMVVGHLSFVPGGLVVVALLLVAGSLRERVLLCGFVVAALGVAATWADVDDDAALEETISHTLLAYAYTVAGFVLSAFVAATAYLGWLLVRTLLRGADPGVAVAGLLAVLAGTLLAVRVALRTVPVVQLAPVHGRPAVSERVEAAATRLTAGTVVAAVLALGAAVAMGGLDDLLRASVLGPLVSAVSTVLAVPLVVALVLAVAVALVAGAASKVTGEFTPSETQRVAAGIAAGFFQLFAFVILVPAVVSLGIDGLAVLALAVFVGPVALAILLGLTVAATRVSVVPTATVGPAAGAAGLLTAGVGAGLLRLPAILVFATVAGALVVWDVGTYGLGVTVELGHRPDTRRLELFHGVAAVGVGAATVLGLAALNRVRTGVVPTVGGETAMAVAVVGVLLLLVPLRG